MVPSGETVVLLLITGGTVEVGGSLDGVATRLENAARSSAGTLAWFDDPQGEERLGVNPSHVVLIRQRRD